jgi:hypothetical protein
MFTDTSANTHIKGYGAGGIMFRGAQAIRVPRSLLGAAQEALQRLARVYHIQVFHWSVMQKVNMSTYLCSEYFGG